MNPGAEFTTRSNSLIGRASVMIADVAGFILAQSTIFMTFLQTLCETPAFLGAMK
jgi:hypothetical protein